MIDCVEEESEIKDALQNPALARQFLVPGLSFTVIEGGYTLASFGIVPIWQGRGFLWMIFDKNIGPKRFVSVVRKGELMLKNVMDHAFHRVEAYVQKDYENGKRLADLFHFKKEGEMKKFIGGKDYTLYARTE